MAFQLAPLLIAAALSGGGTLASMFGQRQAARARDDALGAERIRQRGFDAEAANVNEQSRGRFENVEQKQGETASKLAALYAPTGAPPEVTGKLPTSNSNLVLSREASEDAEARAFGQQQAGALGNLRAFGDLFGSISRGQARDSGDLGMLQSFQRGSQGVLPLELEAANAKGAGPAMIGQLLSGLGAAATGYALSPAALPSWLGGAAAPAAGAVGSSPAVRGIATMFRGPQ